MRPEMIMPILAFIVSLLIGVTGFLITDALDRRKAKRR